MAYKDIWIQENYNYIISCKMIIVHIVIMLIAIFGVIGST